MGLLRLLAFCAPEPVPLRLLLQPRPGLADGLADEVAAVLMPLLGDELAAEDAVAALRRYSLVTPAGDGRCWCTGWCRRSPSTRCPRTWHHAWQAAAAAADRGRAPR